MITQELRDYIRQQLGAGIGKDVIKQTLFANGWAEHDINDAFFVIEKSQSPQPIATPPPAVQQIVIHEPMQTYTQQASSSGHKWIWAIVVVVLLLVCAGGAFAAYHYNLVTLFNPSKTATSTNTTSTTTTSDQLGTATTTPIQLNSTTTEVTNQNEKTFPFLIDVSDGAIFDSAFRHQAKIEVFKGETLMTSTTTQEGQTANTIFNLPVGKYTVRLSSDGYVDGVLDINVKETMNDMDNIGAISLNPK